MSECRKISIAYISPGWPLDHYPNGIVTPINSILPQMISLGHKVSVYSLGKVMSDASPTGYKVVDFSNCHRKNLLLRMLGYIIFRCNRYLYEDLKWWFTVKSIERQARRDSIEIIESEESFGFTRFFRFYWRKRLVLRIYGPWFLNGRALGLTEDSAYRKRVEDEGTALRKAIWISTISDSALSETKNFYKSEFGNTIIIPNSIPETSQSKLWDQSKADLDSILFVGRFDRHKGGDVVIEAFRLLLADFPELTLTFVGPDRGYIDDNNKRWSATEFAISRFPDPSQRSRVTFTGFLPHSEINKHRQKAFVTIVASRYETMPNVVLEGMTIGSPLVASRTGGIPEVVIDEKSGLLFEPGSASDLAEKIRRLKRDPELMGRLSAGALERCRTVYSSHFLSKEQTKYYESILEST